MKTITAQDYLIQVAKEIIAQKGITESVLIQRELTNHIHHLENTQDYIDINLDAVQYLAKMHLAK
jgi:hypothetical protein